MIVLLALTMASALGQSWSSAYEAGLAAARAGKWLEARKAFQQAAAYRTEDVAAPTVMPGPPTERRHWRGGAAYSPNFLAAYSLYRAGLVQTDPAEQTQTLNQAAAELETLIAKGQLSRESFFFLNGIYTRTGNAEKRQALETKFNQVASQVNWKVDTEAVAPEELAVLNQTTSPGTNPGRTGDTKGPEIIKAGDPRIANPGRGGVTTTPIGGSPIGAVPVNPAKFALVIGNSESRLQDGMLPFAADDAQRVREALVTHSGYAEANVDLIVNATAAQMLASAQALAERMPQEGTITIYFAGAGTNLNGKDYLAGVDTELRTDTSTMLGKAELFRLFMAKGANIFAFFEVNRPIIDGTYFGKEVPLFGLISQMQATMPGQMVNGYVRNGKTIGLFTDAFSNVMTDLRSNRLPIMEFGWQVFYKMRRGNSGVMGGGSNQTPTLPVLTNLAADARF